MLWEFRREKRKEKYCGNSVANKKDQCFGNSVDKEKESLRYQLSWTFMTRPMWPERKVSCKKLIEERN